MKQTYIQIGAGAGDQDSRSQYRDGFTELVKALDPTQVDRLVLVEPNPINIPYLTQCWQAWPQAEIHCLAIRPQAVLLDSLQLFYHLEDGPHYQVTSMQAQHVLKHYPDLQGLRQFTIPALDINQFMNSLNLDKDEQVCLLSMDIEGIDYETIMELDLTGYNIENIAFEYIHIQDQMPTVAAHLAAHGYTLTNRSVDYRGFDVLASRPGARGI